MHRMNITSLLSLVKDARRLLGVHVSSPKLNQAETVTRVVLHVVVASVCKHLHFDRSREYEGCFCRLIS